MRLSLKVCNNRHHKLLVVLCRALIFFIEKFEKDFAFSAVHYSVVVETTLGLPSEGNYFEY